MAPALDPAYNATSRMIPVTAPMLDAEQRRVLRGMALALIVMALVLGTGAFLAFPFVPALPPLEDRLAFALRCDLFVLAWLAAGIAAVARGRFFSVDDIHGSGFGEAGPRIAVASAVLRNALEQVVLAIGAHLVFASLLRGREMVRCRCSSSCSAPKKGGVIVQR